MKRTLSDLVPAILALTVLILLAVRVPVVFSIILLGLLLALIFHPVVKWSEEKFHLSGTKSTALVYSFAAVLFLTLLGCTLPVLFFNLSDISLKLVRIQERIQSLSPIWYRRLNGDQIFRNLEGRLDFFTQQIGNLLIEAVEVLAVIIAAFVLSFYIIKDRRTIKGMVLALFPFTWRNYLQGAGMRAGIVWERFVGGQFFIAFLVGLLETCGLILIHAPYPFIFGLIGGLSNLIPYIGPFVGAVPAVIAVLLQGSSLFKVLGTVLIFLGVQQIDNWILTPRIMKGRLGLHPAVTILSVLAGAELFGFLGATLAVPVVGMIWSLKPKRAGME